MLPLLSRHLLFPPDHCLHLSMHENEEAVETLHYFRRNLSYPIQPIGPSSCHGNSFAEIESLSNHMKKKKTFRIKIYINSSTSNLTYCGYLTALKAKNELKKYIIPLILSFSAEIIIIIA